MDILKNNQINKIILNTELDFKTDLGWYENLQELEDESLKKVINPIDNYETIRYIHEKYTMELDPSLYHNDIWFYFYFYNSTGATFNDGLDYNLIGITYEENSKMLKQSTESFFRLEFYKTPNNEPPNRTNRKLVYAKNLSVPLGEKYFYSGIEDYIHIPVFTGSNYRNKENMYLFWFMDDSVFVEPTLTGNTFYMTARFFNSKDGNIINFVNNPMNLSMEVVEERDLYYKMIINRTGVVGRTDYSYMMYMYTGATTVNRYGTLNTPIKFYEMIT